MQSFWSDTLKHVRTTVYDPRNMEDTIRLAFYSACTIWILYAQQNSELFLLPYFLNEISKSLINMIVKEQWLDDSRLAGAVLVHFMADWVLWLVTHCVLVLKCQDLSWHVMALAWLSLAEDYAHWYFMGMAAHQWFLQQIKLLEQHGAYAVVQSWFGNSVSIRLSEVQHTTPPSEAPMAA